VFSKKPVVTNSHSDCILIGGTSLDVSLAGRYHSPPTLLLNVPGQVAAFWEINKKKFVTYSVREPLYAHF